MANEESKFEVRAYIAGSSMRNKGGDKEITLKLKVVGAGTIMANKLNDLPPEKEVIIVVEEE